MIGTVLAFTFSGVASRMLALGICGKPYAEGMGLTVAWVTAWSAAGLSFADWKERQERQYLKKLQYLIDRKERRDKWDSIYFSDSTNKQ